MLDNESFEHLLKGTENHKFEKNDVKQEVDEEEAFVILSELVDVMRKHNLSYGCAYKISLSFAYAMTTGAVELYNQQVIEELE